MSLDPLLLGSSHSIELAYSVISVLSIHKIRLTVSGFQLYVEHSLSI